MLHVDTGKYAAPIVFKLDEPATFFPFRGNYLPCVIGGLVVKARR